MRVDTKNAGEGNAVRAETKSPREGKAVRTQKATAANNGLARRHRARRLTFTLLIILLVLAVIASAALGQYYVSIPDVLAALGKPLGLGAGPGDPMASNILWNIRFPRIALGLLVGAALATSGAVMQAVFSNPLAEPGIVGVSSGAALGASFAIVTYPMALAGFAVPLSAFATGLGAALLVYVLSRSGGQAQVVTLVLTGIAVTAVASALTAVATYMAPSTARDQIVFWQLGSLAGASWTHVMAVGVIVLLGLIWAQLISRQLDLLALGDRAAGHLGINVGLIRICAITLSALLAAAAVAYAGVIGFVGLIVPHLMRLIIGPANRYLIPAALLGGALLITLADLVSRNLIPFADLPIGIFTALVGGPTFFILLRRGLAHQK
ncbi:FecCD family ABC transporter permease [Boudabousia liubingyangii]|uniref:FecCD family ABC transporter permease n=1 Tax=Boudabousia liubingyangii TaxID=1921764 RepID=UPI0009F9532A|nr:iron ABC transporter permease [Boudabousia liubingyangii]